MSERYTKIFSLTENLYSEGAPVIVRVGALLKDNETSWLLAQLKLENIQDKAVKLVKIEISCLDSVGRPLGAPIAHEYLDLSAPRGADFGAKSPIKIANSSARSFTVRVLEVAFADNTVWTDKGISNEALPKQTEVKDKFTDTDALSRYKSIFGNKAAYIALEHKDLWLCTCGAVNHAGEEKCHRCNASLASLKSIDESELSKEGVYSTAVSLYNKGSAGDLKKATPLLKKIQGYKDATKLIEKCEEKNKKFKLAAILSGAAILLGLLGYFVCYPLIARAVGNYIPYINIYEIEEFEIPDGVTEIEAEAFYGCSSLTSVTIPDSVTSIGEQAFAYCSSLASVTIPDSVTSIGNYAFEGCSSLTSVTIPDSVTSIGEGAFESCSSLTSVTIPDSVTSIGRYAFYWCSSLKSVIIPDSVTEIGYLAFARCSSLTSVTIPDSVTEIGDRAFEDCSSLTSVTIPDSVTEIGWNAFEDCYSLTSVTIPDSVTSIGDHAFSWCYSLTSITIPDSVTSIGRSAFENCSSLRSVTIPDSVTEIGDRAFRDCYSLRSVVFKDTSTWYYTSSSSYTGGNSIDVTDATKNAKLLSYGYDNYYWYKK